MMRSLPVAAAASAAALTLGACGFTPLYAVPGVNSGLSSIEVHVPHGRTAFLLGEDLEDAFARDRTAPATYRLDVTVAERRYPRGLEIDNVAERYEADVTITYQLVEIASGKTIKKGSEPVEVTYDAAEQPYAGIAAQLDAQKRAAEEAAERIRIDLGAYFASKAKLASQADK